MAQLEFKAHFSGMGNTVKVQLSMIGFQEDDTFIMYSPALDLSGYGANEEEARESFDIVFQEFLTYTINKNTLKAELVRLGWKINNSKKSQTIVAPIDSDLLRDNEHYQDIFNNKEFRKYNQQIEIPELV